MTFRTTLRETRKSRQIALDRHLSRKIRQANFGDRLHNQHLELGPLRDQEACVDPCPRGSDWMPITPKTGSLFHADSHPLPGGTERVANFVVGVMLSVGAFARLTASFPAG